MSHWAQDAPQYAGRSDEDKQKIASKYYDEAIGPLYKNMGVAPLSKDVWLRQAWHAGLSYDPASAYRNSVLKGALHGATSASAQVLNAARTLTNLANLPIATYADSIKNKDITGLTGFYNLTINMHNRVKEEGSVVTGIAKTIEDIGEAASNNSKWAHDLSSNQSFWRDVTPARGFTEKATSFVVENAMLLPFFGAIGKAAGLGVGLVGEVAEGVPMIRNLTQVLGATKLGQTAAKAMTYGTEGLIFGNLTTDVEDKKDAWKTALQFAAAGTLFSGLGKGVSKLKDMLPDGAEKVSMEAAEHEAELGAQGKRSATPDEYLDQYRTHLASTMTAGGVPLAHGIIEEALAHVRMEEVAPLDAAERKTWYENKLADDPIHWKSMSPSITIIKQYLDKAGVKLSDMTPEQQQGLTDFLDHQVHQAAEEMDMRVPELQRVKGKELMEDYMKTPEGEAEWKQELAKQQEAYRNQPDGAKKAPTVAQAEMVKRRMAAVRKAAEEKNVTGPENVRKNTPDSATAAQRTESRYDYDKSGKVTGYQMAISFNWKAQATKLAEAKGGKDNTKFWNEYVKHLVGDTDDDIGQAHALASDLRDYFNPLKEYGLTFEKANTEGGDWTNFLAYMYSYKDKLPGPVATKLEDILMNSPKMSELLGSRPTVSKIQEFGQAIQNHVDIFTRSKWYRENGERNVFRSSQPGITGTNSLSKWQRDQKLMKSAHKADLDRAKEFFPGRSKAMVEAKQQYITTLKLHQSLEMAAYLKGKPSRLATLMAKGRSIVSDAGGR